MPKALCKAQPGNFGPPCFICAGLVSALLSAPGWAATPLDDAGKLSAYGDFRARVESDWDSRNSDGSMRDDRTRLRVRFRAGLTYKANDNISFGARLRTGSDDNQQSAHITLVDFDGNPTGDADVNFDKWYVEYRAGDFSTWLGRNSVPMWKPDELVFDDDITPAGLGLRYKLSNFTFNAGYFTNPAGMRKFSGNSALAQVTFDAISGGTQWVFAAAAINIDADRGNSANRLYLDGNGERDYTLWVGNVQASLSAFNRPLKLNLDLFHNSHGYSASDPDPFTAFHRDETDGYVLSARLGDTKKAGRWLFGYFYAYIEQFAVNNSLTQDDWVRWGNATQVRASNFKGSEFRAAVGLGNNMDLVARLYLVKAIKLRTASATALEDGKRFRIDFNWKF